MKLRTILIAGSLLWAAGCIPPPPLGTSARWPHHGHATTTTTTPEVACEALGCPGSPPPP